MRERKPTVNFRAPVRVEQHWISDRWWAVLWYDYPMDALPQAPDGSPGAVAGYCDPYTDTLHIFDGTWQTFLHELLEAIKASGRLRLAHANIEKIEEGLAGWLRGNGILD